MSARTHAYFLLGIFLLLPSCSREETPVEEDRVPIQFSCTSGGVEVTKADASFSERNILSSNQHFAVFGWNTGSGKLPNDPGIPNFWRGTTPMDVTFVDNDYQGRNNTYNVAPLNQMVKYWPRTDTPYCYSFWAYYPYNAGGSNGIVLRDFADNPSDGTVGIFDFTVQSSVAKMVDFCVADVANDNVYGTTNSTWPGTVALSFHHMLTRVQFKFLRSADVAEGTTIKLMEAKLLNINKTSTLTVKYARRATPDFGLPGTTTFEWGNPNTLADYDITVGGVNPVDGTPGTYVELGTSSGALDPRDVFLMVPQNMVPSGDYAQKLYLKWEVKEEGKSPTSYSSTLLLDQCHPGVGDPEFADADWGMNQFITYTILIGAKPIQFDEVEVKIEPWSEDVTGYYPIIA